MNRCAGSGERGSTTLDPHFQQCRRCNVGMWLTPSGYFPPHDAARCCCGIDLPGREREVFTCPRCHQDRCEACMRRDRAYCILCQTAGGRTDGE